jgi:glycolate oxidase FAD binding subunit
MRDPIADGQIEGLIEIIHAKPKLLPRGGMTKTGIKHPAGSEILDLSTLSGIKEYNPSEYTFTTLAGTRLLDIEQMLQENGQFLPFDPPLVKSGATIGGTAASNLSGPLRYHYGGVRDFILGVQFLDDQGRKVKAGGKVVKNAAGFDIPKLMVGSLGGLGTLIELSFKVFPHPKDFLTLVIRCMDLHEALNLLMKFSASPVEILSLDMIPEEDTYRLELRIGGERDLFKERIAQIEKMVAVESTLHGEGELAFWEDISEFTWITADSHLVKIPLIPMHVQSIEEYLAKSQSPRRYSAGANVLWVSWSAPIENLDNMLKELNLKGLILMGESDQVRLGSWQKETFYERIKSAIDPSDLWVEV